MAGTTWNPADRTNITLSLGNLRAATTAGGASGVRGIASQAAGKFYWEYTYTTVNTNSLCCGIALSTGSLTAPGTGTAVVTRLAGTIQVNAVSVGGAIGAIPGGGVVGIAVDFAAQLIWFRLGAAGNWNGSGTANPATGAGGVSISTISSGPLFPLMSGSTSDALTANFGDSAFSGAVPSGFVAGFPAAGTAGPRQSLVA
jgi:hypothetical protein